MTDIKEELIVPCSVAADDFVELVRFTNGKVQITTSGFPVFNKTDINRIKEFITRG